jgi:hypothetical protein
MIGATNIAAVYVNVKIGVQATRRIFCPDGADHRLVIAGPNPAIHLLESTLFFWMGARVKPGHDDST